MSASSRLTSYWRATVIAVLIALVSALGVLPGFLQSAQAATSITINGGSAGKAFDGVGAVSGGGGNSQFGFQGTLNGIYSPPTAADLNGTNCSVSH